MYFVTGPAEKSQTQLKCARVGGKAEESVPFYPRTTNNLHREATLFQSHHTICHETRVGRSDPVPQHAGIHNWWIARSSTMRNLWMAKALSNECGLIQRRSKNAVVTFRLHLLGASNTMTSVTL